MGQRYDIRDILPIDEKTAIAQISAQCNGLTPRKVWGITSPKYRDKEITLISVVRFKASSIRSFFEESSLQKLGDDFTRFRAFRARVDGLPEDLVVFAGKNRDGWVVFRGRPITPVQLIYGSWIIVGSAGYRQNDDLYK